MHLDIMTLAYIKTWIHVITNSTHTSRINNIMIFYVHYYVQKWKKHALWRVWKMKATWKQHPHHGIIVETLIPLLHLPNPQNHIMQQWFKLLSLFEWVLKDAFMVWVLAHEQHKTTHAIGFFDCVLFVFFRLVDYFLCKRVLWCYLMFSLVRYA